MTDQRAAVGVIGGSGFYEIDGLTDVQRVEIDTPFGPPSDAFVLGALGDVRVAFVPRHGTGHRLLPAEVAYRANIWALASLGVEQVVSVSAVGSLREEIAPLDMIVPDQMIDRTSARASTFFGRGIAAHVSFDRPFCGRLSAKMIAAARADAVRAHEGGTYVVIEGPAFSTRAESELYRSWGASIIGMTALPEAKLAREAGMCYATLACVTDYDVWHPDHDAVTAEMIIRNLQANVGNARRIVARVIASAGARTCGCGGALADAIVTPMRLVPEAVKAELAPILARARGEVTA